MSHKKCGICIFCDKFLQSVNEAWLAFPKSHFCIPNNPNEWKKKRIHANKILRDNTANSILSFLHLSEVCAWAFFSNFCRNKAQLQNKQLVWKRNFVLVLIWKKIQNFQCAFLWKISCLFLILHYVMQCIWCWNNNMWKAKKTKKPQAKQKNPATTIL